MKVYTVVAQEPGAEPICAAIMANSTCEALLLMLGVMTAEEGDDAVHPDVRIMARPATDEEAAAYATQAFVDSIKITH